MRRAVTLSRALCCILLSAAALTGCSSWTQWKHIEDRPGGKATTKLLVRTVPTGAEVSINGDYQGKAPLEIPVRYPFEVRVYERSQALPYPHREERELRSYSRNVFRLEAYLMGRVRGTQTVTASGEETLDVTITLPEK